MKIYEKPSIHVFELQLKESIAKVPTTVYKNSASSSTPSYLVEMALTETNTGLTKDNLLVNS